MTTHEDLKLDNSASIKQEKQLLRKEVISRMTNLTKESIDKESLELCGLFKKWLDAFLLSIKGESLAICTFNTLGYETNISYVNEHLKSVFSTRDIFYPLISTIADADSFLEFFTEEPFGFHQGSFGIEEPLSTNYTLDPEKYSHLLIIVPAVAFTPTGERLGRGMGFYDKAISLLSEIFKVTTVGLCLQTSLLEKIPTNNQDEKVDKVLFVK